MKARFWILSLTLLMFFLPHASAMGPPPSVCSNLYYGQITSAIITYPSGALDAIAHPNATVTMQADQTYDVTLVVHTSAQSRDNNSLAGTLYVSYDNIVYVEHACFDPRNGASQPIANITVITGNINVELKFTNIQRNQINVNPQYLSYSVLSSASASSTIYYGVNWVAATTSSISTQTSSTPSTSEQTSTTTSDSSSIQTTTPTVIASSTTSTSSSSVSSSSTSPSSSTTYTAPEFGTYGLVLVTLVGLASALVVFRFKRIR